VEIGMTAYGNRKDCFAMFAPFPANLVQVLVDNMEFTESKF